jgi:hypothetical protein
LEADSPSVWTCSIGIGKPKRLSPTAFDSERAFDWMPILAEALNEAGCDHVNVLMHSSRS